jgi:lipoprotein-anchoring transpeptidase ErfK/SrfK
MIFVSSLMPVLCRWLLCAGLVLVLTQCGPPAPPPPPPRAQLVMYQWYDTGGPGEFAMRIRLSTQMVEFRRGDRPVGWSFVATGREGHATRPGKYRITERVVDKISNRYGWLEDSMGEIVQPSARFDAPVPPGLRYVPAPMPFWMRLTDYGIGLHGGVIPEPGRPASHGCIRLPNELAPRVYAATRIGTPVEIVP